MAFGKNKEKKKRTPIKVKEDKTVVDRNRKNALVNLYFHRYLMIRYFLAAFMFANFSWLVLSWGSWMAWIPAIMMVLVIYPALQLGVMFGRTAIDLKWTKLFYWAQWFVCIFMMIMAFTCPLDVISPSLFTEFMTKAGPNDIFTAQMIIFSIALIGFGMSSLVLRKFYLIDNNKDKQYGRIRFYETKYKISLNPDKTNV